MLTGCTYGGEQMEIRSDIDEPANEQFQERLQGQLTVGLTRRNALKAGMAVSNGLVFGGTVIGTPGANDPPKGETENIVSVHYFVRAEGTDDGESPFEAPTPPKPEADELLVERFQDLPVDDGTDPDAVDGEMGQLTWGQFRGVEGRMKLKCLEKGTHVSMHLSGLVPRALYTVWVVVFDEDDKGRGFIDDRNLATATKNIVGWAPLGKNDGSENVFRPSASDEAQLTAIDRPDTWPNGPAAGTGRKSEKCLLDEFEVHFVGGFHLDDETQGSQFRPNAVEQFAFIAKDGDLI